MATVEAVGAGHGAKGFYVYECSEGDFVSRESAEAVEAHIATEHPEKSAKGKGKGKAAAEPEAIAAAPETAAQAEPEAAAG